jgi:hypothetical protein
MGTSGATNFTRGEARTFARSILESETYRKNLETRAAKGELPPAVETMLWHYAYGKPLESIALTVQPEDLTSLSAAQLAERALAITAQLKEAEALEGALVMEPVSSERVA